jgi:DNA-binding GntR family transcriptional regulator
VIDVSLLNTQVERALKDEIMSGALAPGQKLDVDELARRWAVSTTPIRDAVRRLDVAGFVTVVPRRGVYVAAPNLAGFKEVFDLRIALECLAIRSAAPNLPAEELDQVIAQCQAALATRQATGDQAALIRSDQLVHDLFLRHCGNAKLVEIMDGLSDLIKWARTIITQDPSTYDTAGEEHLQVLQALKDGRIEAAEAAMRTHLENSFERTRAHWNDDASLTNELTLNRRGLSS